MGLKNFILIKNKKGIFFTILVLVILTLFFLSYSFLSGFQERKTIQKRIETMNSFLFSIEENLQRQLFISGYRIIFLMEQRIIEKSDYIDDVETSFPEAFFNGTIENVSNSEVQTLMTGAKFSDIENDIKNKANKINTDIILKNPSISISQEDPWNVKVTFVVNLTMRDISNLALWNKTEIINAYIPVEGFQDPTYFIEELQSVIINKTIYTTFDASNLQAHAQNTYYINNTGAPSFLDRLEGNINIANHNGIESLAVPLLPANGVSIVDYEYFQSIQGSTLSCMPAWFRINLNNPKNNIYNPCDIDTANI